MRLTIDAIREVIDMPGYHYDVQEDETSIWVYYARSYCKIKAPYIQVVRFCKDSGKCFDCTKQINAFRKAFP